MRSLRLALAFLLIPALAFGQGLPIKSGATSDLATVDLNKNVRIAPGASTRPTYLISTSNLGAATAHTLSIESSAGVGFKLIWWCVSLSNATAATSVTALIQRRTTASSGGTLLVNEGTGTEVVAKADPADANYSGIARVDGVVGTAGAVLDQQRIQVGIIATGAGRDVPKFCRTYGLAGEKLPTAAAGTTQGISISIPNYGAGSLSVGMSAGIIQE